MSLRNARSKQACFQGENREPGITVRDPVRIAEGPTAIDATTQRRHFGFRLRLVNKLQPIGGGSGRGRPLSGTWKRGWPPMSCRLITQDIPARVAADPAFQNAKENSDRQNARIEHDKALGRAMTDVLKDDTQLFKQFSDNESFRRWLTAMVLTITYETGGQENRVDQA